MPCPMIILHAQPPCFPVTRTVGWKEEKYGSNIFSKFSGSIPLPVSANTACTPWFWSSDRMWCWWCRMVCRHGRLWHWWSGLRTPAENDLILLDNFAIYFGVKMRGVNSEVTGGGYSSIQCTCWTYTIIESRLDQELSVVRFGLSDGELPNYVLLMVRLLTSGFSAILSSIYWILYSSNWTFSLNWGYREANASPCGLKHIGNIWNLHQCCLSACCM